MTIEEQANAVTAPSEQANAVEAMNENPQVTEQVDDSLETDAEAAGTQGDLGLEGPPDEYTPNTKFQYLNSEQEFDSFLVSSIKNEEDEKRVRELYERAYGIDHVKEDRQYLRDENTKLKETATEFDRVRNDLQKVGHQLKQGDYDSFFQQFGLTDEQIANHLLQKQQILENPQLKQQYDQQRQQWTQSYDLQQQNQQLQAQIESERQRNEQFATMQRESQLSEALSDPSLSSHVQAFDARMGEGAFRNEVINRGQLHWQKTQQDLSPREAVNQVASIVGFPQGQGASAYGQPAQNNVNQPVHNAPQMRSQHNVGGQPPVIPNIEGSNTTPVKKIPKSIDDLRRLHQTLSSQ